MDQNKPVTVQEQNSSIPTTAEQVQKEPAPETSVKPFPKVFIVIIILVVMVSLAVGGYILGTSKIPSHQQFANTNITTKPIIAANTSTPTPTSLSVRPSMADKPGYIKRNFDPNVMYAGDPQYHIPDTKYPVQTSNAILSVPQTQLLSFNCSPLYQISQQGQFTYYDSATKSYPILNDKQILEKINKIANLEADSTHIPARRVNISYCTIEDGRLFIAYTTPLQPDEGLGFTTLPHLGISNASLTSIEQLPMDKNAYGDCNDFLQLTKTNQLYYRCESGDGDTGQLSLFQEDVSTKTLHNLLDCHITTSVPAPSPPIIECK